MYYLPTCMHAEVHTLFTGTCISMNKAAGQYPLSSKKSLAHVTNLRGHELSPFLPLRRARRPRMGASQPALGRKLRMITELRAYQKTSGPAPRERSTPPGGTPCTPQALAPAGAAATPCVLWRPPLAPSAPSWPVEREKGAAALRVHPPSPRPFGMGQMPATLARAAHEHGNETESRQGQQWDLARTYCTVHGISMRYTKRILIGSPIKLTVS